MRGSHGTAAVVTAVVLVLCLIAGAVVVSGYNSLVTLREQVDRSFGDVETQMQRRADLIPNLVQTVSAYMEQEREIIESVNASRERLLQSAALADLAEADALLSQSVKELLDAAGKYPELKSSGNFVQLQDELAGTENRIAVARRDYNAAAEQYNTRIQKFPMVIFANMLGLERAEYFRAAQGAGEARNVSF